MPKVMEYTEYLGGEIGPRPTGTEEEQQAALYITEKIQKDAGLPATIEDFNSNPEHNIAYNICFIVSFVLIFLTLFFEVLALPAIIITLITAVLVFLENHGKPILGRMGRKGISQNVIAKYDPNYGRAPEETSNRSRKIVVVAHYDSGRTRSDINGPLSGIQPILDMVSQWALISAPIYLIIRYVVFNHAVGVAAIVLTVISCLYLICIGIQLFKGLMFRLAKYNNAANNNATGVAVMMDLAARINKGNASFPNYESFVVHGEAAARAAGVVPRGADLVYAETAASAAAGLTSDGLKSAQAAAEIAASMDESTPEGGLLAAKAAIAAMTGKPVNMNVKHEPVSSIQAEPIDFEPAFDEELYVPSEEQIAEEAAAEEVAAKEVAAEAREATRVQAESEEGDGFTYRGGSTSNTGFITDSLAPLAGVTRVETPEEQAIRTSLEAAKNAQQEESDDGIPAWFKRAQANARRKDDIPVARSVYNDALEAATTAGSAREEVGKQIQTEEETTPANNPIAGYMDKAVQDFSEEAHHGEAANVPVETVHAAENKGATEAASKNETEVESEVGDPILAAKVQQMRANLQASFDAADANFGETTAFAPIDTTAIAEELASNATQSEATTENSTVNPAPEEASEEASEDVARPIVLPNLNTSSLAPINAEDLQQRAPLAEAAADEGNKSARGLLSLLPDIDTDNPNEDVSAPVEYVDEYNGTYNGEYSEEIDTPRQAGAIAGATAAFTAVDVAIKQNADEDEDLYIDDAEDESYGNDFTATGAYAGAGYVDMPKKKKGFFGKLFGKKNEEEEISTSEWLGVDEDFDAREVGKARGGWESFREQDDYYEDYYEEDNYAYDDNDEETRNRPGSYRESDNWEGGAFDRFKLGKKKKKEEVYEDDYSDDYGDGYANDYDNAYDASYGDEEDYYDEYNGYTEGDYVNDEHDGYDENYAATFSENERQYDDFYMMPNNNEEMLNEIFEFENNGLDTEVWFVALGSEYAGNSGMRAFLKNHKEELRGAIFVELDALGAGELCFVESEGKEYKCTAGSRMKRYAEKAADALGISLGSAKIPFQDSACCLADKEGFQAMHFVGMDGSKPAYLGQSNDTMDNIDEQTLLQNEEFVMEVLKSI